MKGTDTARSLDEPRGFYAVLRHLSIDVVAGTVGGAYMAARIFDVKFPWAWWVILGISVWLVYTLDHLLDVWRLKTAEPTTARHRLHRQWFRPLVVIWILLLAASLVLTWLCLPMALIKVGGLVAVMAMGHLGLVVAVGSRNVPGITKEIGVALVYSAGIWIPAWYISDLGAQVHMWKYLVIFQHFVLAFSNVLLLSLYERRQDEAASQTSMVLWAGEKGTMRLIQVLLGLAMVAGGLTFFGPLSKRLLAAESIMLLLLLAHAQILFFPELFRRRERYRAWADISFSFTWIMALA